MGALRRVYRNTNDIDFPKVWRPFLVASLVMVVIGIVSMFTRGLNLAIDFEGGSVWEVPSKTMTSGQAEAVLAQFGKEGGAKVQVVTDAKGTRVLRVQADATDIAESQKIADAFAKKAGVPSDDIGTNTVGPSWGSEITKQAAKSLVVFLVLIALYISWQLEWRMAIAALIAVLHDVIITIGVYSIFGFEVTPATVISFLTILGYSLYDTIVVYDRVQENSARYDRSGQYTYTAVMRRSMNQVLMRSINTTTVSLLPVVSMLLVGSLIFGQEVIRDFSLALFIGLLSGAYSSIFIAAPVVTWFKEHEPKYRRIRQRAEERGMLEAASHVPVSVGPPGRTPTLVGAGVATSVSAEGETTSTASGRTVTATVQASKAAQYQRPHPPRPRKQKRR
jgi:preprotein translocase subunit SecF